MSFLILFLACNKESTEESFPAEYYGTEHQVTTYEVRDICFDGAMTALFMPQGNETPQEFEYPVYIPSLDELPLSYEISLREPFVGMEITTTDGGEGTILISDAQMDEVALGGAFGECVATMTVTASIVPNVDHFALEASIEMTDFRGDDFGCPVPQSDECRVELSMQSVPN